MKDHQNYVIECRDSECKGTYEILARHALSLDEKDQVRKVRCGGCGGAVKVVELGVVVRGRWSGVKGDRELKGRARSAAVGMMGER